MQGCLAGVMIGLDFGIHTDSVPLIFCSLTKVGNFTAEEIFLIE